MILFKNTGAIDIRALTTFGLSSKAGQDKIGRFGTGLKYATAVIARHGGSMSIQTHGETFSIGSQQDEFRGREVSQLTMNGAPLPYTTDLGRDWEPWMAFRELYANALDEGGDVFRADCEVEPCGDETIISVSLDAFEAIFFTMEEHFIGRDETPIYSSAEIEVHKGRSHFIFYRGIAIMKLREPAAFRYNLKGYIDLTEDRTAKYEWQVRNHIASAVAACTVDDILRGVVDQRNSFEATIDFSTVTPSDAFLGASVAMGANCNPTAMALVRAQLPNDAGEYTAFSTKDDPGAECFSNALILLRAAGADLSKCKFVLASGVKFYGDHEVRKDAVFLNESIFLNQDRMTVAVFEGYAEVVGKNWLVRRLIDLTAKEHQAA